jgi:O-antigen/teichoic acid export membrane protein
MSRNITSNVIGQGLLLVLSFAAVRYVFRQLGEDVLGIIYFSLTLNAVLCGVLEMGISSTIVREVSMNYHDKPEYVRSLIKTASLFYWCSYVLLSVVIYLCAGFMIEKWIHLSTMDSATATFLMRTLFISAFVALPRSLYVSVFRGIQQMEINNIIDVAATALQQIGIVLILAFGGGLLLVTCWLSTSFFIGLIGYIIAMGRYFRWRTLIPEYNPVVIRKNSGYSSKMMSVSFLSMVHMQADKLLVSKLLPIGLLGYYGFAYSVASKATLLTGSVAQAAFPLLSFLNKSKDRMSIMRQYYKLHDLVCFGAVPLLAALPFAALPLFGFVFNENIAKILLLPITFLSIGFYMNGTVNIPYVFSLAAGKPGISAKINLVALFIVLPVTVLLVYFFGINGAGFSWVFYHLVVYSYGMPMICSECMEIKVSEWYRHVLGILVLTGLSYGAAWLLLLFIGVQTLIALCLAYAGATIIFISGSYFMIGDDLRVALQRFCGIKGQARANHLTNA